MYELSHNTTDVFVYQTESSIVLTRFDGARKVRLYSHWSRQFARAAMSHWKDSIVPSCGTKPPRSHTHAL